MKLLVLADDDSVRHAIQTERADVLVSCGDIFEAIILLVAESIQCPRNCQLTSRVEQLISHQAVIH